MHLFEVVFVKDNVSLMTTVEIEEDLLIVLAKGQIDHNQITGKFFDNADIGIKYSRIPD